ncbi:MAG: 1-deoxy-D-xylulose-5-phosphate synthase [Bacteroidales bacterium]|nr:1-deoxy-D-xylulose-5-phosphate synthase [Bacteroidales bacterium]
MYELLNAIETPADLKKLPIEKLPQVCDELRHFIIESLSNNPGHFGASLGVVELTVALHYVFNTPYDKLIWDVGHQAYGHKILTGRRKRFVTNRKHGGLSGFPNIFESEYDAFGVGHSSTSISAALGMAIASHLNGETDRNIVAVIGDGSLTGGMAYEALNNMASANPDMLVILNDNNMAIDNVTGGMSQYLLDISTSKTYNKFRTRLSDALAKGAHKRNIFTRFTNTIKNLVTRHTNMFEGLNIRYFGPADGHNVIHLVRILQDIKKIKGPKMLHIITVKGKGFKAAEENQTAWHAVGGRFDIATGRALDEPETTPHPPKFQDVFGNTILELARKNDKILGITPAMPSGCSLNIMMKEMPNRTFDVGIAEQHAVTFSAGLAISGYIPFCNIYSSFAQRAFDQIIHDVALQKLNVVFCFDRAGIVGADGATHHGIFDVSMLRPIPNLVISSPMNEIELRNLMFTAQLPDMGPFVIRYPRGRGSVVDWQQPMEEVAVGRGRKISEGNDVAVLTLGPLGVRAQNVARKLKDEGIGVEHYDMRFAKPLDTAILDDVMKRYDYIVTIEDGSIKGGFGAAIVEYANEKGYKGEINVLGIPDRFIEHGTVAELHQECGLDEEGIRKALIKKKG